MIQKFLTVLALVALPAFIPGGATVFAQADMTISQTAELDSSGPAGGPHLPQSQPYDVFNTGTASMTFTASSTQAWCGVFAGGATISAGSSWSVVVYIEQSVANTLPAGTYTDTVTFTNTTNGSGNTTRNVTLTVTPNTGFPVMTVTPATGITASGPVGGPFTPGTTTYTLANTGTASLNYTVVFSQPWLTISPSSGTLTPGQSVAVNITINSGANGLGAGTYNQWPVSFFNTTNSNGTTSRSVTLTVAGGGGGTGGGTVDTTPPTVSINSPGAVTSSPVLLIGTASDNIGVTGLTWTNSTTGGTGSVTGTTSWSASVPLATGSNTITVTASDAAGNTGSDTVTVTFSPPPGDSTAPSITIDTPTTSASFVTSSQPIDVAGTASDNVGLSTVTWQNTTVGSGGTATGLANWLANVKLSSGVNVIVVTAIDLSGNSATDTITITYNAPAAPPGRSGSSGSGGGCAAGAGGSGFAWLLPLLGVFFIRRR